MSQDTSNNVDLNCTIFAEPSGKIVRNAEFATFNPGHKCLWNNRCRITWEQTENVNMFGHVSVRQTSSSSFIIWCIFKCLLVLFVLTGIWTVLEQLTNSDWMLLTRLQSSLLFFFFFFFARGLILERVFPRASPQRRERRLEKSRCMSTESRRFYMWLCKRLLWLFESLKLTRFYTDQAL